MRRLAAVTFAVSVLATAAPGGAAAATPDLPLKNGDFAGSVGIGGGRTIYLECYGQGSPTVVLDSGLRNGASIWAERTPETPPGPTVLPGVARFTRVCAYDRPGTLINFEPPQFSRSSPLAMPRTVAGAASDLGAVLEAAKVPGPYVLVSHSTGGLIDRLYAADHRRRVAGLVLVDALAEFIEGPLNEAQMDAYEAVNNDPIEGLDYPDLESYDFRAGFAQLRRATKKHPLPDVPLTVLSHGKPFGIPAGLPGGLTPAAVEKAWRISQDELAKLTPDAVHIVARNSSHYIQLRDPRLVIDQTRRVVEAVRHERGKLDY